jgi:hypothetical protein
MKMVFNNKFLSEKYRLERNPFLEYAAKEDDLKFWVDREDDLEKWKKLLSDASNGRSNFIAFIIGDYGMGKSLSLFKIVNEYKEYRNFFFVLMNFKGEEKPKKPGIDFIQRIFKSIDFNQIHVTKESIGKLTIISREVKNVYEKIFFGEDDLKDLALYFLRGELKPTQSQLRKLEVLRKIDDIDIAKEYFKGLLYLLTTAQINTLVLAIDEFEYLFSLVPKPQQSIYLAALRGLYDLPLYINGNKLANIVFFLAVSEDGYRRLKELEKTEIATTGGPINPLMRRISLETKLTELNKEATRKLIEKRLKYNRIKRRFERDPLIPYTEDFVDFIYESTAGKPGDIIKKCGHVLDLGLKYRIPELNKDFAKKALQERRLE